MRTTTFLLLALVGLLNAARNAPTCSCPEPRVNQVSATSFGMTLLSRSYASRHFNASSRNEHIIKNQSEPILFSENKYYWDQEYYKSEKEEHSSVCTYRISYYNRELRKIKYADGGRPANITFGCHWYQECCNLGCCINSVLEVVIYIVLYLGIALMFVVFCAQLPSESEEERRIRRARFEAGIFFPCQRGPVPDRESPEEQVLREIVNQDSPPKYDDLYPTAPPTLETVETSVTEQPVGEQQ